MDDDLDFDLDEFERECEQFDKEMSALYSQLDNAFEWIDLYTDLQSSVERFNANMNSLKLAIEQHKNVSSLNPFLYGTLLVGVISAYEGFIHELFNACCNKTDYIKKALSNINKLNGGDINRLKLRTKKICSEDDVKNILLKATLHDPSQISRLSEVLFGLKMPTIENEISKKLLEIRNAFTHNNGYLGGEYVKPSYYDTKTVHHLYATLVNGYVNSINKHADVDLKSIQ